VFYLELLRALEQHEVRYVLVGGVAVNLHGIGRLTLDVDLMLALDGQNLSRFIAAMKRFDVKPVIPVPLEDFTDESKVKSWIEEKGMLAFALRPADPMAPTVDVLVKPVVPFEEVYARHVTRRIEDVTVRIAAIEDIIRLKSNTGREKDEADIQALSRLVRMEQARYEA
jgi:hypothetical protein